MNANGFRRLSSYRLYSANVLGTFSPQQLSVFLNVASQDFKTVVRDTSADWLPTFVHEMVHWYQHVTTPYGMFVLSLQEFQLNAISILSRLGGSVTGDSVKKPVCRWAKESTHPGPSLVFSMWRRAELLDEILQAACLRHADYMAEFVNYYFHCYDFLLQKWEGNNPTLDGLVGKGKDALEEYYAELTTRCEGKFGCARRELLRRFKQMHEDQVVEDLFPIVGAEPFGARQIMEGSARVYEVLVRHALGQGDLGDLLQRWLFGEYRKALDNFLSLVGENEVTPGILVLFLGTCELALSTPIHPLLGPDCLLTHPLALRDLHPGWRFLSVSRHLAEVVSSKHTAIDPDMIEDSLNGVCRRAGWPDLRSIAKAGSSIPVIDCSDMLGEKAYDRTVLERRTREDLILNQAKPSR